MQKNEKNFLGGFAPTPMDFENFRNFSNFFSAENDSPYFETCRNAKKWKKILGPLTRCGLESVTGGSPPSHTSVRVRVGRDQYAGRSSGRRYRRVVYRYAIATDDWRLYEHERWRKDAIFLSDEWCGASIERYVGTVHNVWKPVQFCIWWSENCVVGGLAKKVSIDRTSQGVIDFFLRKCWIVRMLAPLYVIKTQAEMRYN